MNISIPKVKSNYLTDRLNIVRLHQSDARFILELTNTEDWIKYIGDRKINNLTAALDYIERILDNPNMIYWTVFDVESTLRIGIITFMKREYLDHWDIGFAFLPRFMDKGLALEAASTILKDIAFNNDNIEVLATTLPNNLKSIKLLKKLGLGYLGEVQEYLLLFSSKAKS